MAPWLLQFYKANIIVDHFLLPILNTTPPQNPRTVALRNKNKMLGLYFIFIIPINVIYNIDLKNKPK